jgi:hypothetical protein
VIIEQGNLLIPLEIKSEQTMNADYFAALNYWKTLDSQSDASFLVYAGDASQTRSACQVIGWKELNQYLGQLSAVPANSYRPTSKGYPSKGFRKPLKGMDAFQERHGWLHAFLRKPFDG